ncbi:polysaccharide deacetylase family protein [Porticoccus sp. GXU_MW_L64]
MIKAVVRKALVSAAKNSLSNAVMDPYRCKNVPIFMLHRMQDSDRGVSGHSTQSLRNALQYLKEYKYSVISLDYLIKGLDGHVKIPKKSVVFTIDDGFLDQALMAVPIFEEFGYPVTIFLLSNFSSRVSWPWDYQVEYVIEKTAKDYVDFCNASLLVKGKLTTPLERKKVISQVRTSLKRCKTSEALNSVLELSANLEIELSSEPPKSYQPITWHLARELESEIVQFGPHTKNHSILAFQSDYESRSEISDCWTQLKKELANPLDVMCYPTGRTDIDYGNREMRFVKELGLRAGLSVDHGYVNLDIDSNSNNRYRLHRFGFPDELENFIQLCSWVELMKEKARSIRF